MTEWVAAFHPLANHFSNLYRVGEWLEVISPFVFSSVPHWHRGGNLLWVFILREYPSLLPRHQPEKDSCLLTFNHSSSSRYSWGIWISAMMLKGSWKERHLAGERERWWQHKSDCLPFTDIRLWKEGKEDFIDIEYNLAGKMLPFPGHWSAQDDDKSICLETGWGHTLRDTDVWASKRRDASLNLRSNSTRSWRRRILGWNMSED